MSGNKTVGLVGDSYVNHFPYHELLKPLGWERLTWAGEGDLKSANAYVGADEKCGFVKEILTDKDGKRGTANYKYIVIFLGGGDVSSARKANVIAEDILKVVKAFEDGGKVPLICGPNNIKDPAIGAKEYASKVKTINDILKKKCSKYFVEIPDILEDTDKDNGGDGCHPSEAGYKKILKAIQDKLNSM